MTISASDLVTFANSMLARAETISTIGIDIRVILADLSELGVLRAEDTSQSLTSTSTYLSYPTDCLNGDQQIISVVLTGSDSLANEPLEVLSGGWYEYLQLMQGFTSSGRSDPSHMVCHERKIYLWPPPSSSYTTSIWYRKRHPDSTDSILFDDSWLNAMRFGTTMQVAMHYGIDAAIGRWSTRYEMEKERQRAAHTDS